LLFFGFVKIRPGHVQDEIRRRTHTSKPNLCVEDDLNLQKSLSFILWREGYEVFCAQTGEQALELARGEKPDLILLDLMLPGIDGLKVCSILKKDPNTSEILVIMVTAKKRMEDVVAGLKDYSRPLRRRGPLPGRLQRLWKSTAW
jgi:CheY-like chemotaxis protein